MSLYIVVPHGNPIHEHHGPTFTEISKAKEFAEQSCTYWKRVNHYQVYEVKAVWTTQTMDEALSEG